nr:MAG TPA: hypothetical protein [Caudoviricetes sp.]
MRSWQKVNLVVPCAARNCASAMPLRRTRPRGTSRSGIITASAGYGSR